MRVIAHRGASRAAAENSVAAFELADELAADGVELDVRRAPDGRLLVAHDPLPADAGGFATLHEALQACGDRMLVNVEIKNVPTDPDFDAEMGIVEATIDELRRWGPLYEERWLISSFSWDTIERCRQLAPDLATAFLCTEPDAETIVRTARAGHAAIHPWEGVLTAELVRQCHESGLAVNAWTCNDPDRLAVLAGFGVDGVCTDVPDEALVVLGRAGARDAVVDLSPRWGRRA